MAGIKGKSGRKPLRPENHLLANTWRVHRHGPRPTEVVVGATVRAVPAAVPPMPRPLIAGLRAPGRAFVSSLWDKYDDWSPVALVLLREAAETLDALKDYRTHIAADGCVRRGPRGKRYPHPLLRTQLQARSSLIALTTALHVREA